MRRLSLVGLVLLVVAAAGCASSSGSTAETAELRILAGTVEVAVGSGDFAAAVDGQVLEAGHTVRTRTDGRAAIEYFDGSVTRLDHDTSFTITTLETLNNDDESKVIEGEQANGNTYTRVVSLTDSASRFDVVTPTATASVQGTVYAVIINSDGSTTVAVIDGGVNVLEGGTEFAVGVGFMVTVYADGTFSDPEPIPAELLDGDWITYNRCDIDVESDCDIEPAPLASIEISPGTAEVEADEPQEYTAQGFDAEGNPLGAVGATYEITDGTCEAASCSAASPGEHTVTGSFGGFTDTATLTVGLGDVAVTLDWEGPADIDLWVTDPNGETVRYDSDSSSGGHLDDDSNKDCEADAPPPPETISWEPGTAPLGSYSVTVDYWTECGAGAVEFTVTVTVNGQVILSTTSTLTDVDDSFETGFEVASAS
ncbi:MAG TPA: hypothetical protein DCY40_02510 [Actinobacteria bacterium]|nr:hypothetical protein [Actinomycetota bacterium]